MGDVVGPWANLFVAGSGLYWMAAGILMTLAATIWNAWVLLVEILRWKFAPVSAPPRRARQAHPATL